MSVTEMPSTPVESPQPTRERRPFGKVVMHWIRRGHLYLGLFLVPWAVLYGVTGFLFNHPTAFSDQPTTTFDRDSLAGTPMETVPPPAAVAARVVEELNARLKPTTPYRLVEPEKAGYPREFAFATVKADGQQIGVLIDATGAGGTLRVTPETNRQEEEKAPFAVGRAPVGGRGGPPPSVARPGPGSSDALKLEDPLHERVKAAVPVVLEKTGYPQGEVTVTSVPDLMFLVEADGKVWKASYNALTGSVSGKPAETAAEPISIRRFLIRLHLSHGYPPSGGTRWFWAVIVDVMAGVMVFWGVSGLLMWWQIKATRWIGFLLLLLSAAAAVALTFGMHAVMTQ